MPTRDILSFTTLPVNMIFVVGFCRYSISDERNSQEIVNFKSKGISKSKGEFIHHNDE